jgi:hypothetical protein
VAGERGTHSDSNWIVGANRRHRGGVAQVASPSANSAGLVVKEIFWTTCGTLVGSISGRSRSNALALAGARVGRRAGWLIAAGPGAGRRSQSARPPRRSRFAPRARPGSRFVRPARRYSRLEHHASQRSLVARPAPTSVGRPRRWHSASDLIWVKWISGSYRLSAHVIAGPGPGHSAGRSNFAGSARWGSVGSRRPRSWR